MDTGCGAEGRWLLHYTELDTCAGGAKDMKLDLWRDGGFVCASMDPLRSNIWVSQAVFSVSGSECRLTIDVMGDFPAGNERSWVRFPIELPFDAGDRVETRVDFRLYGIPRCTQLNLPLTGYRLTAQPAQSIGTSWDAGSCPVGLGCYAGSCELPGWLDAGQRCLGDLTCQPGLACRPSDAGNQRVCVP